MESNQWVEVEDVICKHVPAEQQVLKCSVQHLDSGGLHFSSDVWEVRVQLSHKHCTRPSPPQLLQLVVKLMPEGDKQIENNSTLGFKKEISFYKFALPEYTEVQEKHGLEVNNFPKLFAEKNNIIILNDLRWLGFSALKHRLDEEHTKLVLNELAKFHSTGVALKLLKPGCFQSELAGVVTPSLRNATNVDRSEINNSVRREVWQLLKSMEGFETFAEPVDKIIQTIDNDKLPPAREPYATLLHNDLWQGNIMFRSSSSNCSKRVAFIDFQNTVYNSPARDLVYFIFTSVDKQLLLDFQSMISFYHQSFVSYLSAFGCDTSEFTFLKLMEEVNCLGPTKLKHMILLYKTLSVSTHCYETSFKSHLKDLITQFQLRGWLQTY